MLLAALPADHLAVIQSRGAPVKTIRRLVLISALAAGAAACGSSPVLAPEYQPGPNAYQPGPNAYQPGPNA